MLGDDAQPAESDGHRNAATSGPRHAAPRKPLLIRLHVPAGKAVALAAMPTAVLMGMGFTPHLAQADDAPKSPFKPGPCVSRSDTPTPTASPTASATATPDPTATPKSTGGSGTPTAKPAPTPSPTGTNTAGAPLKSTSSAPAATSAPTPTPTPSATTTQAPNPLDPLGLGNLIGNLLGGSSTPTPSPSPTATKPAPSPTGSTSSPKPSASPTASAPGPTATTAPKSTAPTGKSALSGATDTVKKTVKTLTGTKGSTSGSTASGGTVPLDGSQSYPCPTYDAKALAAAQVEGGIPLLPDQPFTLKSTKLSLHGLDYHGIVQVRTWSGQVKDVLKFTASGIDIQDLWQIVDAPDGTHTWVKGAPGSTSTFKNGTVTLYTESLSGNLLGLIPVTFTPKAPPPLTLPELFFTNVTVVNAGQFGGDLHVPGMQVLPGQH